MKTATTTKELYNLVGDMLEIEHPHLLIHDMHSAEDGELIIPVSLPERPSVFEWTHPHSTQVLLYRPGGDSCVDLRHQAHGLGQGYYYLLVVLDQPLRSSLCNLTPKLYQKPSSPSSVPRASEIASALRSMNEP